MSLESKPLYDFDRVAEKADESKLLEALEKEKLEFTNLMRSKSGFNFVKWLINSTGVFAPNRANNSSVYTNEGRRSVGLMVLEKVKRYTPELLAEIMQFEGEEE